MEAAIVPRKNLYEIQTAAGKLNVEINSFNLYKFVLVSYSSLLRLDGSISLAHPTPFDKKPSVLSLEGEAGPGDRVARELSSQLGLPVVLMLGVELNKQGQEELAHAIVKICSQ